MGTKRKRRKEEFKAKVALEAVRGVHTSSELSAMHKVRPTVIPQWKRQFLEGAPEAFRRDNGMGRRSEEGLTGPMYEEIGRLKEVAPLNRTLNL